MGDSEGLGDGGSLGEGLGNADGYAVVGGGVGEAEGLGDGAADGAMEMVGSGSVGDEDGQGSVGDEDGEGEGAGVGLGEGGGAVGDMVSKLQPLPPTNWNGPTWSPAMTIVSHERSMEHDEDPKLKVVCGLNGPVIVNG